MTNPESLSAFFLRNAFNDFWHKAGHGLTIYVVTSKTKNQTI